MTADVVWTRANLFGAMRRWHLVLADRWVSRKFIAQRDDYFFLLVREIEGVIRLDATAGRLEVLS